MINIFCITAWGSKNELLDRKLTMSIDGIVKYLTKQSPIDNKYYVTGSDAFDITVHNIDNALVDRMKQGMALTIKIKQDYGVIIESDYTISIIMAED